MSEGGKRRLFFVCCALGILGLVVALMLRAEPKREAPEPSPAASVPRAAESLPSPGTQPDPRTGDAKELRATRRGARAFVRAFSAYQRGVRRTSVRRELSRSATTQLARELWRQPVRAESAPRAKAQTLRVFGTWRGRAKASVVFRYRGGRSLFEFELRRRPGGWRVSEVYP